ncbi:MAG: hypothetical protein ABR540_14785 [Acidimicrobiales bacterium]
MTRTRCSAHGGHRPVSGCSPPQPNTPAGGVASPSPPLGRFVQVLTGEVARFAETHGLGFDDRSLLEHLLLAADHRSGAITPFSLTDLACDLGLGPSGRRTLRGRLERLSAAGAVSWVAPSSASPGRIEVLVYARLVHAGAADRRRGFVQIVPSALTALAQRYHLSPTATALLTRLLVQADPRTQTVMVTTATALARELALGWRRLSPALDELGRAASVEWSPGRPVRVLAYDSLVRTTPSSPGTAARSDGDRAADASHRAPAAAISRGPQDVLPRVQDQDLKPKTTPPDPPRAPAVTGADQRGWGLVVDLEAQLTEAQRQALHQPADRGRLAQLATELGRLASGGWTADELLAHVGAELPGSWRSPARLLWARAQALPTAPPNPDDLRAAADAVRTASQIQAARAYAANQAAVGFLEAAEIVARLAECYSGEALEAALVVLAQCRPDDDVAGAVRHIAESSPPRWPSPHVGPLCPPYPGDDPEAHSGEGEEGRGRRRAAGAAGPVEVGRLLADAGEGWA